MRKIQGIVPVLSTPLLYNGDVDENSLVKLLDFLLEKQIGGLWVLGTGSEDMNLTFNKRLKVAKIVSEYVNLRVPVMLGASFFCMEDTLNFFDATKNLSVDAWHVMPYHPLLSNDRLVWYYQTLAEACPGYLWLYTSANWSPQLSFDSISQLKTNPKICGIKYSTTNSVNVLRMLRFCDETFQMITAVASQAYACFCMGSQAHTSSLASAIPDILIDIYNNFKNGNHEQALEVQHRLDSFLYEMSAMSKKDNFLSAAEEKYILSVRGICADYVSSYYRSLTFDEKEQLKILLNKYCLI